MAGTIARFRALCDFFPMGGYLKSLAYTDRPKTFRHLKNNIRAVIANIDPVTLEKEDGNFKFRLSRRVDEDGGRL